MAKKSRGRGPNFSVYSKKKGKLVPAKGKVLKQMKKTLTESYNYRGRR